jgi:antitoxin (DNA-binding transcriptional repressor) of toxin-antitoxin stability system
MLHVSVEDARKSLPSLIDAALRGEHVYIDCDGVAGRQSVRLVAARPLQRHAQFGSAKGLISIAEDFDAPLEDFGEYR